MEERIQKIEEDIENIKKRNTAVEIDKAWERSFARIISISIITYVVAVIILWALDAVYPFLSACVPVLGFILSTQSLPVIKRIWVKNK